MAHRQRPVRSRTGRFAFLCLLSAVLTGTCLAAPADKPKLKVAKNIALAPIRADEIVPGAPNVSAGSTGAALDWQGSGLSVNLAAPDASGIVPYIVRPIADLWSLKFTPNDPKPLGFVVSYTLTSLNGVLNALGSTSQPGATLTATVIDLPVRVDLRNNGMMDVYGDAELRIDTSSVGVSGQYVGDLLITVSYL